MTRPQTIARCAIVLGAVLSCAFPFFRALAVVPAQAQAGSGAGPGIPAQTPTGRGGRGSGNPAAAMFGEHCGGCHGTDLAGGRAPTLFDEKWLASVTDVHLTTSIRDGVRDTEMEPFKAVLNDQQIWQLIQYIRTQSGALRTRPAFVANPSGVVLKTEKATVRIEVVTEGLNTPWGLAFLPDGRLLVTERTVNGGTLRIVDNGVLSAPVKGTPTVHVQQDAGMFDVEVHPRYAENGWIYLSYAELRPGYTVPVAPVGAAGAQPGRGRGGVIAPSMTTIVRGRLSARNEWVDQQFVFRAPLDMYTTDGAHFGSRFIFDREGHLFYSIGDRGVIEHAQDLSSPLGKIHRVNDDGSPVAFGFFVREQGRGLGHDFGFVESGCRSEGGHDRDVETACAERGVRDVDDVVACRVEPGDRRTNSDCFPGADFTGDDTER